ncbi:MAG: riboflavin synthase [Thermodesulfobacteriota bacterium]
MFTGIIQGLGSIKGIKKGSQSAKVVVETSLELQDLKAGDSIAVDGICLTITGIGVGSFRADASSETINKTTLGGMKNGDNVNLEKALRVSDFIGGHWVSGHVEGQGVIIRRYVIGDNIKMAFKVSEELQRFVIEKGSIALNGVSLTVNDLIQDGFEVNLIPYTLKGTTFPLKQEGDKINVETDIIGKYVERFLTSKKVKKEIDMDFLTEHGF